MTDHAPGATYHVDLAVVGAGPLGSATARHAAEAGASTLLVGPDEPVDAADHRGTWAGYYDQGRLCHVLEVPLVTSLLAMRSRRRFADLIARTGVDFLTPTHSVTVLPERPVPGTGSTWFDRDVLAGNAADLGVAVDHLDEEQLRAAYPGLRFEPGHVALRERDAFILNPRGLVAGRAPRGRGGRCRAGARRSRRAPAARAAGVEVICAGGGRWTADRVVVATGAATNATGLLDRALVTPTFGATVVLAEVAGPDAVRMPTMMMLKVRDESLLFGGIVMAPVEYPDGRWYLKVSGSSLLSNPLDTQEEIAAWVRTGGNADDIVETRELLGELLPDLEVLSMRTRPCLVCATPSDRPYLDWADESTVVVVEGERGAMAADELGRLAAGLALTGRWSDSLPHEVFAAEWAELGWTTAGHLAGAAR